MKHPILSSLDAGVPIFTVVPRVGEGRIFGLEFETGSNQYDFNSSFGGLPRWTNNGGRIYLDCGHLEVCTPETSNPLSAVLYARAMTRTITTICSNRGVQLFLNNCDWQDQGEIEEKNGLSNGFGSHESYSTFLPLERLVKLAPFLVARCIFTSVGWVNGSTFHLSQRARFIRVFMSTRTREGRGLFCSRPYENEGTKHPNRFHLICGESNMSDVALFLRLGFTSLMIELEELGALPRVPFYSDDVIVNLHALSAGSALWIEKPIGQDKSNWMMTCLKRPVPAVALLKRYLAVAHSEFKGRDPITDAVLIILSDTLELLEYPEKNFDRLSRRLDWAAKLRILRLFQQERQPKDRRILADFDMEYHRLGDGLSDVLYKNGQMEKLASKWMFKSALASPPTDTRAAFRGWLVSRVQALGNPRGMLVEARVKDWGSCAITNAKGLEQMKFIIADPFQRYDHLHEEFYTNLKR